MSSIQRSLSNTGLKALPLPPVRKADPEQTAEMFKRREEMKKLNDPGEIAKRIAEQRAIKVHTVFKVDGKVVGIIYRNGWSMFASNSMGGAAGVHDLAARRGLAGEGLNDLLAEHYATKLQSLYGTRLQVEHYEDAASAPTSGEVEDLMFGRTTGRLSRVV